MHTPGLNETVVGWPSCLEKGSRPSTVGADHCIIDSSNIQAMAAAKNYGWLDTTLSPTRIDGHPAQSVGATTYTFKKKSTSQSEARRLV